VGDDTIIGPGSGFSILRVMKENKFLSVSFSGYHDQNYLNPEKGGYATIVRAYLEHILAGFIPIGITDCLNYGNPEDPEIMGEFVHGLEGMNKACKGLDVPVISGNVSFYNESANGAIKPLIEIGMVGLKNGFKDIKHNSFTEIDSVVYELNLTKKQLYPSVFARDILKIKDGSVSFVELKDIKEFVKILKNNRDLYLSARVQSKGGSLITIFKMFLNRVLNIKINKIDIKNSFSESPYTMIFQIAKENEEKFKNIFKEYSIKKLGNIKKSGKTGFMLDGEDIYEKAKNNYDNSFTGHLK
ncbi:hypothetical protein J7L48_06245, partial [bacterium]|nr:hypothetical protein [bacterium]